METSKQDTTQTVSWWITSLAISVTCCAILFVIFAGSLARINKNIDSERAQLDLMTAHESQLLAEIQSLKHSINQASPSTAAVVVPSSVIPAVAPVSVPTAPAETTASPTAPAATQVPEVIPSAEHPATPPAAPMATTPATPAAPTSLTVPSMPSPAKP